MRRKVLAGAVVLTLLGAVSMSCDKDNPVPNTSNDPTTVDSTSTGTDPIVDSTDFGGGCGNGGCGNGGNNGGGVDPGSDSTIYTNPLDSSDWNP